MVECFDSLVETKDRVMKNMVKLLFGGSGQRRESVGIQEGRKKKQETNTKKRACI